MEQNQERDTSSDEERHIIVDEDMEDSPTDTPDLWMSDRDEEDKKFVRGKGDTIPTKKRPMTTVFERSGQGWYGHTDFVSHRQVLPRQCAMRFGTGICYLLTHTCNTLNMKENCSETREKPLRGG